MIDDVGFEDRPERPASPLSPRRARMVNTRNRRAAARRADPRKARRDAFLRRANRRLRQAGAVLTAVSLISWGISSLQAHDSRVASNQLAVTSNHLAASAERSMSDYVELGPGWTVRGRPELIGCQQGFGALTTQDWLAPAGSVPKVVLAGIDRSLRRAGFTELAPAPAGADDLGVIGHSYTKNAQNDVTSVNVIVSGSSRAGVDLELSEIDAC